MTRAADDPLAGDLDEVLAQARGAWTELADARLFITGGTGFFGCWLLETFTWAVDRLGLRARAVVLTRDPERFARKAPHLAAHAAIDLHRGDVRDFAFPGGAFSHVVHAATDVLGPDAARPAAALATIVDGTRRCLAFATAAGASRLLLTSSGAVYGPQATPAVVESATTAPSPTDPRSAYGEGKRVAELLAAIAAAGGGPAVAIARCFAFVGPYLDLDGQFAIGNFIRDALRGGPIVVGGDGTPLRSYLYASDLAAWLWTMLVRAPSCRPFNVGGGEPIPIAGLAHTVARCFDPTPDVRIARPPVPGAAPARYVPDIARARDELGLAPTVPLAEAIARTVRWHRSRGGRA